MIGPIYDPLPCMNMLGCTDQKKCQQAQQCCADDSAKSSTEDFPHGMDEPRLWEMIELYKEKAMNLAMYYDPEAIAAVYLAGKSDGEKALSEIAPSADELSALKRDAARWRKLADGTGAQLWMYGKYKFLLPSWLTGIHTTNLLKGSVAGHLNDAADAAIDADKEHGNG